VRGSQLTRAIYDAASFLLRSARPPSEDRNCATMIGVASPLGLCSAPPPSEGRNSDNEFEAAVASVAAFGCGRARIATAVQQKMIPP
jgi:hypothetical protein